MGGLRHLPLNWGSRLERKAVTPSRKSDYRTFLLFVPLVALLVHALLEREVPLAYAPPTGGGEIPPARMRKAALGPHPRDRRLRCSARRASGSGRCGALRVAPVHREAEVSHGVRIVDAAGGRDLR